MGRQATLEGAGPVVVVAADPPWWRRIKPVWWHVLFGLLGQPFVVSLNLVAHGHPAPREKWLWFLFPVWMWLVMYLRERRGPRRWNPIGRPGRIEIRSEGVTLGDWMERERLPRGESGDVTLWAHSALGPQLAIPVDGTEHGHRELRDAFVSCGWSWRDR